MLALQLLLMLTLLGSEPVDSSRASLDATIEIDSLLVIEAISRGGRAPVLRDAIEAQLVSGGWRRPTVGQVVIGPEGDQRWERIEANDKGAFQHSALRGGYALAVVESDEDRIALLDARGHRHVYVNGVPRGGDVYDLGWTRLPIPLRRGENELLFKGGRGRLRARITAPPADVFVEEKDPTLPDAIVGETDELNAAIGVTNATGEWQEVTTEVSWSGGEPRRQSWRLAPLSTRKLPVAVPSPGVLELPAEAPATRELIVQVGEHRQRFSVRCRRPSEKHRRTFSSDIDGSVQFYGVTPARPTAGETGRPALFLSLHGAGVEAMGQANSYRAKSWGVVIAPNNRRRFGFDWEDWGRLDALEVLERAETRFGTDRRRTYLTGHSMGGHGTWSIGAMFPDRFAAIAPSAGWRDFGSYGGQPSWTEEATPVERILDRAQNASRTLLLEKNYAHGGVYLLHGDKDDNVPVTQARFMRKRLAEFHPNWAYYERPGAGHWWGNQCMDWPPLFDFLAENTVPLAFEVRRFEFTTLHPSMSDRCYWLSVVGQRQWMVPSRVAVRIDLARSTLELTTENVTALSCDLTPFLETERDARPLLVEGPVKVVIDGAEIETQPVSGVVELERVDERWGVGERRLKQKGPHRAGPFKDAFRNRMVFVVPTLGGSEVNSAWYAKARYDAETFQYRGNGSIEIVRDVDVAGYPDRNLILYGNQDVNAAWSEIGGDEIEVTATEIRVGSHRERGLDLALLAVRPRRGSDRLSVGVVGATGLPGLRSTHQLGYWISGAGFPDWIVYGSEMMEKGSRGVRGAGYFDRDWRVDPRQHAWRD